MDVLADKLPPSGFAQPITKGLLLTFKPKSGHESTVEQFLLKAKTLVEREPKTAVWFEMRTSAGSGSQLDPEESEEPGRHFSRSPAA